MKPTCVAILLLIFLSYFSFGISAFGQDVQETLKQMQAQMQQMQEQIHQLQKENKNLKEKLNIHDEKIFDQDQSVELHQQEREAQAEDLRTIEEKLADFKPTIVSKYKIDLYGYIKFDAAYDTSRVHNGNFALWALSDTHGGEDDQFNATANQTRIGAVLHGPELTGAETTGRVEIDFYGGGDENKPHVRMRQAYIEMLWPHYDVSILAGQTWDVISPLYPTTLNFLVQMSSGNIGYRRPQLRLTKGIAVGEKQKLLLQTALSRTIGDSVIFSPGDTGEDYAFPTMQGRVGYTFPGLGDAPTTLGLSGHFGREEYDFDTNGLHCLHDSYSVNFDLTLPIIEKVMLKSELWWGQNLDSYYGGIVQGINPIVVEEIQAKGGWLALALGPWDRWLFNVGASIDDPDNDDITPEGRGQNLSYFGNMIYQWNEAVQLGLEVSYWDTLYKDIEDGDSLRTQMSLIYKF